MCRKSSGTSLEGYTFPLSGFLLEVFVIAYMMGSPYQGVPWMVATVIAWRKMFTHNSCDLVLLVMHNIMSDLVNAGLWNFLPRLINNISGHDFLLCPARCRL